MDIPADLREVVDGVKARRTGAQQGATGRAGPLPVAETTVTARQADVLALVAEGFSNPAIAARLCLSDETVKTHVAQMLHRTGSRNRAQLAARWARGDLARQET